MADILVNNDGEIQIRDEYGDSIRAEEYGEFVGFSASSQHLVLLPPDEAEQLAARIVEFAGRVRKRNQELPK